MRLYYILTTLFVALAFFSRAQKSTTLNSQKAVDALNNSGYNIRLTDPEQTLTYAQKALDLAQKTDYKNGIAEASRVLGIGYYYLGKTDVAISKYLTSLSYFKATKNLSGQAKVYNNIGNLYREVNYDKGLEYFQEALKIATELDLKELIAGSHLNIGVIHYRKKLYHSALLNFEQSYKLFKILNNPIGITQSLQNQGVIYFSLNQADRARNLLLEAYKMAKENELNNAVASINLTLTSVYIRQSEYTEAEKYLNEGRAYAEVVKDEKLKGDFLIPSYELEAAKGNYRKAFNYMQQLHALDSTELQSTISKKFGLFEEQYKSLAREKEAAVQLEKAKTNRVLFVASVVISLFAIILIVLLFFNNKKKAKTNRLLKILNAEISLQKENLNRVNQNLEGIIQERTKDLQVKNKKLAEYSSHLSHQIRGPIATMKGLMILEKESLIEEEEFVTEMGKCVNEIDDRIININSVLNDLSESGLIPRQINKEPES